ncbi:hypothetical protein B0F90DRAFT_1201332 [Multifurca ochricompacta]|uniref:Uncharacterized protein n=1 Tax=Multifurca ochricompacta TaxID=376703 RepID=A0AAD4QKW4_9AGAM|nr:hypothetical protein B0F90DRAFT_1201332 [Multifurca ochricompacta]
MNYRDGLFFFEESSLFALQGRAQILRSAEDTLAAVQQAEARLLEISALQAELVFQLIRQTEISDQLYENAITTSEMVEKGNIQLRETRRRARDGRKWLLVFLIGVSCSSIIVKQTSLQPRPLTVTFSLIYFYAVCCSCFSAS